MVFINQQDQPETLDIALPECLVGDDEIMDFMGNAEISRISTHKIRISLPAYGCSILVKGI